MSRFSFYCPFCFEYVRAYEIEFFCDHCNKEMGKRVPSPLEKLGVASSPRRMLHEECGQYSTDRICPHCKNHLPVAIDELSDLTIAIIGAKESGKSHYIALLIHRIKQLHQEFGWTLTALDDATITRYRERFYYPLFKSHTTIPATRSGHADNEVTRPLLYSLRLGKNGKFKRVMLAFFDTAGEDLDQEQHKMGLINRYIFNASGIICLLDPLQLSKVRGELIDRIGKAALPEVNTDTGTILNRVVNLIRNGRTAQGRSVSSSKKINIPLAVAFSKIDTVAIPDEDATDILMPESYVLFQEDRHRGSFNLGEFQNTNSLMRDWILAADDQTCDIVQQCDEFENRSFFGFSALGCNPQETQTLSHDPRPIRVEDPFIWILYQNGLIKGTKD